MTKGLSLTIIYHNRGKVIMTKLNINKAQEKELLKVKGIGTDKAEKIIAYREEKGYFKKIEDLLNIKGIGPKYLERLTDNITVIDIVRITFNPADYDLGHVEEVHLVGEMNNWDPADKSYNLELDENGIWIGEFAFEKGLEYKIMYDSVDWEADKHIGYYEQNFVVV